MDTLKKNNQVALRHIFLTYLSLSLLPWSCIWETTITLEHRKYHNACFYWPKRAFISTETMWQLTHRQTILCLWFLFFKTWHYISHHLRCHMKEHILKKTSPWLYVPEENGFSQLSDTSTVIIPHRNVKREHSFAFTRALLSYRCLSMNRADADHKPVGVKSPRVQCLWWSCHVDIKLNDL